MTIGFVQQAYKVVEGEEGVTLEVEVSKGQILPSHLVVTLATTDQSANGTIIIICFLSILKIV